MLRFRALLCWSILSLVFVLVLAAIGPAAAQRAMPDAAPLPNFNPLCDSSLVHCLEIDDFAGHIYGHLQVLPKTDHHDTAAVFPLGVTLGLFGRFAGGISTSYSFWNEGGSLYQQLGPLRLSLIGRLLPLFPLLATDRDPSGGDSSYAPPRSFQLGLAYEHEVRVGPFSGANSLGLLVDLASLSLVGSKALGSFQISGSLGALYDWRGSFATPAVAAQLSLFLPGFQQLKVFVEGMGRGFLASLKPELLPSAPDGQAPIRSQGMFGGGLAFRAHKRVDLGVAVQRGFGGIAPWVVSVNFLVISVGKTYQGRAATPIAQTAADVAAEFFSWAVEKLKTIDPYLKNDCILYDDDHKPIRKLGELSPDGKACIYEGLAVPIGPSFWHNKADTVLCYDRRLTECFLTRSDRYAAWEPIHPLLVREDCFAYYNGQPWMRVGKPSSDKRNCENQGHIIPVGQTLKPDHEHTRYYCYDEPDKAKNQTRKSWCLEKPEQPVSDVGYAGRHGIARGTDNLNSLGNTTKQVIEEVASGMPLHASTPVKEAEAAGRGAIDAIKDAKPEDAERVYRSVIAAAKDWWSKPPREKLADVADSGADIVTNPLTYIPGGAVAGKGGRLVAEGLEVVTDAAKAGKRARHAVKAVEHATADAFQAEKKAAQATSATKKIGKSAEGVAEHTVPPSHLPSAKPPHGNLVDDRPATLYMKVDEDANLLKHGVTRHENPRKRYTRKEIGDGDIIPVDRGPRREILKKERELVETNPGPDNHEPWAGKRKN